MVRLRRNICLKYEFAGMSTNNNNCIDNKKICVSSTYQPSKGPIELEDIIHAFETKVID